MASVSKRTWAHRGGEKSAWTVRYADPAGGQRQSTFERKKEADAFRAKVETDRMAGKLGLHINRRTLRDVSREYLEAEALRMKDGRISRGRFRNLEQALRVSVLPRLGKRVVAEITGGDVERWYGDLRREDNLAANTARLRVQELKALIGYAILHGAARENPVTGEVARRVTAKGRDPIRTFSEEEAMILLATAETRHKGQRHRGHAMLRLVVNIAAFCGLRRGEIFALSVERVKLMERVIEVRHSLDPWDSLKGPKTESGVRDVPIPEHVAGMFEEWIKDHYIDNPRHLIFRGAGRYENTTPGGPIELNTWYRNTWQVLLQRAGLNEGDNLHFHALRHFAASYMVKNGLPITDVAALLGHKRFDMTLQVYAHPLVNGRRRLEAMDEMAAKLRSATASAHGVRNGQVSV